MKKLILSLLTMASLAFAANAVTYLNVKTDRGNVVIYDVDSVVEVYYDQLITVSGKVGNYTYVDLGLPSGTKWATYNVGATRRTQRGDYFAWGETKPKGVYYKENYKWCMDTGEIDRWGYPIYKYTKYCANSEYGTVDNKTVLEAEDDAATANWGKEWRMPTVEEIEELIDACYWKWVYNVDNTGTNGHLGTSKTNGASIFLPANSPGDMDPNSQGDHGSYWSSSLYEDDPDDAYTIHSTVDYINDKISSYHRSRSVGRCVRAVLR